MPERAIVGSQAFEAKIPATEDTVEAVVDAFDEALGKVLRRPTLLPIPKPVLWARLGREATEALAYASQRVTPGVLTDAGFEFSHPDVESALRAVLDRPA